MRLLFNIDVSEESRWMTSFAVENLSARE